MPRRYPEELEMGEKEQISSPEFRPGQQESAPKSVHPVRIIQQSSSSRQPRILGQFSYSIQS
eukprot:c53077_g1_i1 orf=112-297(+)